MLPYLKGPWRVKQLEEQALCYSRLDLRKAYPSVNINDLRASLLSLLSDVCPSGIEKLAAPWGLHRNFDEAFLRKVIPHPFSSQIDEMAHPWTVLAGPGGESLRHALGERWISLLENTSAIDESEFNLGSVLCDEPGFNLGRPSGIPTGLAVGGLLLQVVLSRLDQAVLGYLESQAADQLLPGAYLRFVDDIIVLATDKEQLTELLLAIKQGLLEYQPNELGLRLEVNWSKAKPESIKKQGPTLGSSILEVKEGELITPERRGEFVTDLVERLSELQSESILTERTGRGYERLSRLLELSRWNIQDAEVRSDTRTTFALNALTRAWLPAGNEQNRKLQRAFIEEIRSAAKKALEEAPWKPSAWRAIVRASLRTAPGDQTNRKGRDWLRGILSLLASWENEWSRFDGAPLPEEPEYDSWQRREEGGFRSARVSFLRTCFWREVAKTIRELSAARHLLRKNRIVSHAWHIRVLGASETELSQAAHMLGELNEWARILYPQGCTLPWWEVDALQMARRIVSRQLGFEADHPVLRNLPDEPVIVSEEWSEVETRCGELLRGETLLDDMEGEFLERALAVLATQASEPDNSPHRYFGALHLYHRLRTLMLSAQCERSWLLKLMSTMGIQADESEGGQTGLHQLLWSQPSELPVPEWTFSPTHVPSLGLPREWAIKLYGDLLSLDYQTGVPQPCISHEALSLFTAARHRDLGHDGGESDVPSIDESTPTATWSDTWFIPPHPVHLMPRWRSWEPDIASSWHATFALFLALDGSEAFHDRIFHRFPTHVPWSEVQWLRCKQLLPKCVWHEIDFALGGLTDLRGYDELRKLIEDCHLLGAGTKEGPLHVAMDPHYPVLILEPSVKKKPTEPLLSFLGLPTIEQRVPPLHPQKSLRVRLAQLKHVPKFGELRDAPWPHGWGSFHEGSLNEIDKTVDMLLSIEADADRPHIVVFPELTIPPDHAAQIARDLASHDIGMIGGLFWRELEPPIVGANEPTDRLRYFVNEAILSIPNPHNPLRHPFIMTVRKPRPANIEYGFQKHFLQGKWRIVPGKEWLMFEHEEWGPFAIAICSDILDPAPWATMRARILHLFLVAWNTDVELYKAMTRTRGYELYVNLVVVNHGESGGSLAWSPHSGKGKLLFCVEGRNHFVTSDVTLDVAALAARHAQGIDKQRQENEDHAAKALIDSSEKRSDRKYKALPLTPWPKASDATKVIARSRRVPGRSVGPEPVEPPMA
jgi:hypothetical protein